MDWRQVSSTILDAVYPQKCALCDQIGQEIICPTCHEAIESSRFNSHTHHQTFDSYSLFKYEDRAGQAVRRLKYDRITSLGEPMAVLMRAAYDHFGLNHLDLILPVPIHWRRRTHRGFNQSDLLAELLPPNKLAPDSLLRIKKTRPQVELTPAERLTSLEGAFRSETDLRGMHILLVDDVITTGGTAEACTAALKAAGADQVTILTFCGERLSPEDLKGLASVDRTPTSLE